MELNVLNRFLNPSEEPLELCHQKRLSTQLALLNVDLAEYSFANLYLFRHLHQYHILHLFDSDFIKGRTRDHFSFLMPLKPLNAFKNSQLQQLMSYVDFLFPIPEQWLSHLDSRLFQFHYELADSDYLIAAATLKNYAGRHLDGHRNHVKNFVLNYHPIAHELTKERVKDAIDVLERWKQEQKYVETDFYSCKEALELFEVLSLKGIIIYTGDKPIGFSLGESLNATTYSIHFIKALKEFKGVYQYLYQMTANSLAPSFTSINLEQDLGLPTLRKSKQSYHPERLLYKFRVTLLQ